MSAHDDFSLHDDEELSLHDDASLAGSLPASNKGDAPAKPPQIITTNTLSNIKLPVLQKDDYDTWAMEMEHYLEYIDNEVWKVIQNGNHEMSHQGKGWCILVLLQYHSGEQFVMRIERKAKTLLLNGCSKSSSQTLEKGYDRFQKLLSQLEPLVLVLSDGSQITCFEATLPPAWTPKPLQASTSQAKAQEVIVRIPLLLPKQNQLPLLVLLMKLSIYFSSTHNADDVDLDTLDDLEQIDDLGLGRDGYKLADCYGTAIKIKNGYTETCKFKGSKGSSMAGAGRGQDFQASENEKEALMTIDERSDTTWVNPTILPSIEQVTIATQKTQPQVPEPQQTVDPSCAQHVKTPRQPIRTPVSPSPIPSYKRQNWNQGMQRDLGTGYSFVRKPCFVCGSLSHLIKDCDYYEKKMAREAAFKSTRVIHANVRQVTPAWTNSNRVNKANQFTPRPVQLNNIRPNFSTASRTIKTGRVNVNSGKQEW
ncbi:hypothetical protein Tco_0569736 [Tanacetum coccineum]